MLSGEAANTNFIVFGLTRPWLKTMIYHTQGEKADHYTHDACMLTEKDKKHEQYRKSNEEHGVCCSLVSLSQHTYICCRHVLGHRW